MTGILSIVRNTSITISMLNITHTARDPGQIQIGPGSDDRDTAGMITWIMKSKAMI